MNTSTSSSVGWDPAPLMGNAWSSPLPSDAPNSEANATSPAPAPAITKEKTVDVNDYSRFNNIGDDGSDNESSTVTPAPTSDRCRNCNKPGAKLKCSVCKKAVYCARTCQASDWKFHKRICKKPEAPKPKPSKPQQAQASDATPKPKPKPKVSPTKKSSKSSTEVVSEDPELPKKEELRGYKNGLPYFHRELSAQEQQLIGDIAPKKVEAVGEVAAAPVQHEGAVWNAAGTFEEHTMTKWAEQQWKELFADHAFVDGEMSATLQAPESVAGDASICVVRGKKRFLYDFTFKLPFRVEHGGKTWTGSFAMQEVSNDDTEMTVSLSKTPTDATKRAAVQEFVSSRSSGLQKEVLRLIGEFMTEFQKQ